MENISQTIGDVDIEKTLEKGDFSDEIGDVNEDISDLEIDIAEAPDEGTKNDLRSLKGELLDLRSELSGDKDKALEIYQRGPANHQEIIEMVHGLAYEEARREHLIQKYGKSCFARCRAFFAGELDSHLISGVKARQDKAESTRLGRFSRRAIIAIFNRKNIYAAGAAVAVGVLTGGIGGIAAGVVVGGIIGRGAGEAWESIRGEEKSARGTLLEKEREYWLRLQDLASDYKNASEEEKVEKLKILIDEFNKNSNSAAIMAMTRAREDLAATIARWNKTKLIVQTAGGLAGGAAGFAANAFWMHGFSGVDMDYQLHNKLGQQAFHDVQKINGVWHFAYKTGEAMSHPLAQNGALWHTTGEAAWRIYAAAAAKAAPTIAGFLLANLGRKKSDHRDEGVFRENARFYSNRVTTPADSIREAREEAVETATLSPRKEARAETAPEGIMTREEMFDDSDNNDWRLSRRAAMIILGRVQKYAELKADTEEEQKRLFIEKARELLKKEITIHWRGEENEKNKKRSDLDGETALYLLKKAVGGEVIVNFVPQGQFKEGHLNIDTGEKHGITFESERVINGIAPFPRTAFIDHHGEESWIGQSAAALTYKTLISLGLLKPTERLDKLVDFVNHADDMTGPFLDEKHFEKSHLTIAGLYRAMRASDIFKFFENDPNPDPTRNLEKDEPKKYGIIFKVKEKQEDGSIVEKTVNLIERQETKNNEAKDAVTTLKNNGKVIETPYGKLLVDEGGTVKVPSAALSKGYIHLKYDDNGFFVSGMPRELSLPEGRRMRNMWMSERNKKPTISLDDIISVFRKPALAKAA